MSKLTTLINQSVIAFTFDGDDFIIDCQLEGIQANSKLFKALDAQSFIPVYDLNHNSYEFVTPEALNKLMPFSLTPQAC